MTEREGTPLERWVVEEAFAARGRGVHVLPRFTAVDPPRQPFRVRLRLPSGALRTATAVVEVAHVRGALPAFAMLRLLDATPEDVPAGTEIEREEETPE